MMRPDLYERSVSAVRETVDELRAVVTITELVDADADGELLVARILRRDGIAGDELDLGLIAGAAFAIRYGELMATAVKARNIELIVDARERGDEWVVLHETQQRPTGAAPTAPYHRLEMRLADGLGLHLSVTADPSTGRPVYGLETVRLDVETGDWLGEARSPVSEAYRSPEPWNVHAQTVRRGGAPHPCD
jgi:hypothetical protein